jgi:hypothetical protein
MCSVRLFFYFACCCFCYCCFVPRPPHHQPTNQPNFFLLPLVIPESPPLALSYCSTWPTTRFAALVMVVLARLLWYARMTACQLATFTVSLPHSPASACCSDHSTVLQPLCRGVRPNHRGLVPQASGHRPNLVPTRDPRYCRPRGIHRPS